MLITINTDASFHPSLKYGAYAFWAKCNDWKITKSGVFRKKCINPDDAETKCIINALTIVSNSHKEITNIIINTDSLNAIAYLTKDISHIRKYNLSMAKLKQYQHYLRLIPIVKNKIKIEYRNVKAHTGIINRRSYVNEWCDTEAKKQLRKKVKDGEFIRCKKNVE